MLLRKFANQDSKLVYVNDALDYIECGEEIVIYSKKKNGYFGISGVAAEIFITSKEFDRDLSVMEFIHIFSNGRRLQESDKQIIREGVTALLELGALHEK